MYLDKDGAREAKKRERHDEEQAEFKKLQAKKDAELKGLDDSLAKNHDIFMKNKELQDSIKQAGVYREEIQERKVKV